MAKYKLRSAAFIGGRYYGEGETYEGEQLPPRDSLPLDDEAKAAVAKKAAGSAQQSKPKGDKTSS
jgi:hypothetical protein